MTRTPTALRRAAKDIAGAAKLLRHKDCRQDLASARDLRGLIYALADAVHHAATMARRFEKRASAK